MVVTGSGDSSNHIVVVSRVLLDACNDDDVEDIGISDEESRMDALDDFNHPRLRRLHILKAFQKISSSSTKTTTSTVPSPSPPVGRVSVTFVQPSLSASDDDPSCLDLVTSYSKTQSEGLLTFLMSAWDQWCDLGETGRDPMASLNRQNRGVNDEDDAHTNNNNNTIPALIPGNVPLPRDPYQRPSQNVMGQMAYYCTDICTPIFQNLVSELQWDAATIHHALRLLLGEEDGNTNSSDLLPPKVVYALPTHPGHHAARDSFGGYCYLNQAAHAAQLFLDSWKKEISKVAILDIDYHCGNGTASIFYNNPNVLVVSIHCHPDHDYPFHSGFSDESERAQALFHLPLLPGATWESQYRPALEHGMQAIQRFGAQALVVSLGLDTLEGDPVTLRRAGFRLKKFPDYWEMGKRIGAQTPKGIPCLFVQEGGYKMDELGEAAANVVAGFASKRT